MGVKSSCVTVPNERTLDEDAIDADPIRQFETWLEEARAAGEPMPNAMAVATTRPDGTPAVRMLLLECVDADRLHVSDEPGEPQSRRSGSAPACGD